MARIDAWGKISQDCLEIKLLKLNNFLNSRLSRHGHLPIFKLSVVASVVVKVFVW